MRTPPPADTIRVSGFHGCEAAPLERFSLQLAERGVIAFHGASRERRQQFCLRLDDIGARALRYELATAYHSKPRVLHVAVPASESTASVWWHGTQPQPDGNWRVVDVAAALPLPGGPCLTITSQSGPRVDVWLTRKHAACLLDELSELLPRCL